MNIVDDIFTLFAQRGSAAYFGETISQLEHALQTAYQADQDHAPDHVVVAALLHDIGHVLHCRKTSRFSEWMGSIRMWGQPG